MHDTNSLTGTRVPTSDDFPAATRSTVSHSYGIYSKPINRSCNVAMMNKVSRISGDKTSSSMHGCCNEYCCIRVCKVVNFSMYWRCMNM